MCCTRPLHSDPPLHAETIQEPQDTTRSRVLNGQRFACERQRHHLQKGIGLQTLASLHHHRPLPPRKGSDPSHAPPARGDQPAVTPKSPSEPSGPHDATAMTEALRHHMHRHPTFPRRTYACTRCESLRCVALRCAVSLTHSTSGEHSSEPPNATREVGTCTTTNGEGGGWQSHPPALAARLIRRAHLDALGDAALPRRASIEDAAPRTT